MDFCLEHSQYGRLELRVSEERHVNGNIIGHCRGVVFTRWRRMGIPSLARLEPAGPRPGLSACPAPNRHELAPIYSPTIAPEPMSHKHEARRVRYTQRRGNIGTNWKMSLELSQAGLAEYWLTAFPKPSARQRCCNGLSTALKMKPRNRAGLILVVSLVLAILALAVPWAEARVSRAMAATASSYLDRGNTWAKKGEWTQADFSLALDFNPDYAAAYYNRGVARSKQGNFDLALQDFERAVELNPLLTEAYVDRGASDTQGKICRAAWRIAPEPSN